jgi:hypothetical protein
MTCGYYGGAWPQEVKQRAYEIDPECWISYSGRSKAFKRQMDARRTASLEKAAEELAPLTFGDDEQTDE